MLTSVKLLLNSLLTRKGFGRSTKYSAHNTLTIIYEFSVKSKSIKCFFKKKSTYMLNNKKIILSNKTRKLPCYIANIKQYNNNSKLSYFNLEPILGHRKAKFINRLEYWLHKCGRNITGLMGKWIYNSLHAWATQLNCSVSTIRRVIKSLEEEKILLARKINAKKFNQTKWYTIDYIKLNLLLRNNVIVKDSNKSKWMNLCVQNEHINNNSINYTRDISSNNKSSSIDKNKESKFYKQDRTIKIHFRLKRMLLCQFDVKNTQQKTVLDRYVLNRIRQIHSCFPKARTNSMKVGYNITYN